MPSHTPVTTTDVSADSAHTTSTTACLDALQADRGGGKHTSGWGKTRLRCTVGHEIEGETAHASQPLHQLSHVCPMEHAFGATTSIGLADVRTLVQLIANRIERDDTSRDFEIHTKTITITTLHAASKVRLRFTSTITNSRLNLSKPSASMKPRSPTDISNSDRLSDLGHVNLALISALSSRSSDQQ